ncbi:MAG: hypothetical protein DRJ60_07385 [Thermoprotei archaeon]|nr:MAG: hypothetical protein DRJ60_07385 [Thermoprotei archaeon]
MARTIRVRFEGGVLHPLDRVEFREGEELVIRVVSLDERKRLLERYRGFAGRASKEELDELLHEAKWEGL